MTSSTSSVHDERTAPPLSAGISVEPRSARNGALTAGVGLLLIAGLAGFAKVVALDGLVTPGDATRTAADISASPALFRSGIASMVAAAALDVVVAWALYRVFARVNGSMSLLAAWLRLAYAAVFLVAIAQLLDVPRLLAGDTYLGVFSPEQRQAYALARVDTFGDVWNAGLVLFGLHLLLLGYLAYRSRFVPRALGVLLAVAGAGYAFDSGVAVLAPDAVPAVSSVTFLGEFLLALWLVTRGRRATDLQTR
jgi:Domain of unknown function (DUF4386)